MEEYALRVSLQPVKLVGWCVYRHKEERRERQRKERERNNWSVVDERSELSLAKTALYCQANYQLHVLVHQEVYEYVH